MNNVSVIGLGKLGVPLAACYAHRGFAVVGADVDRVKVDAINAGRSPVTEPEVQAILSKAVPARYLVATTAVSEAVRTTDFTVIMVNTPDEAGNAYSLKYVFQACESIGRALRDKDAYHLIMLSSTVMPGTTSGMVRDALERISGKRCGTDFGLCHVPEFLAIGSAVRNILSPDFLLIGECDERAGEMAQDILLRLVQNDPPVRRTSPINAELAKIALNTALVCKISFANYWAMLCGRVPGADVDEVMRVVGMDHRIGPDFLTGSVAYGGPCFPRDALAWTQIATTLGLPLDLPLAVGEANERGAAYLSGLIDREPVGILGLAYKPGVSIAKNSLGVELAKRLDEGGKQVYVYDPQAMPSETEEDNCQIPFDVRYCHDLESCIRHCECLVICTPWLEFEAIPPRWFLGKQVIDCWRLWDEGWLGMEYIAIGRG
jgi:UDPglucose 6-dehydrogenase